MIDMTDRVVLIIGAAGGIGSATARALVGAGALVNSAGVYEPAPTRETSTPGPRHGTGRFEYA
jgi:nucleoside-diphosphate-sugar epimerase